MNTELVSLYWQIGRYISSKLAAAEWGEGVVDQLAQHLACTMPGLRGFTRRNLFRMRQFFETYTGDEKVSALLTQLPWTHNLIILGQSRRLEEREFYLRRSIQERWSSRELERQFRLGAFEQAVLNPPRVSPAVTQIHGAAAATIFKDTYVVEFLDLPDQYSETDLHRGLLLQLKAFLIELGRDFCFIGSEYPVQVGGRDFALDLLFFHRGLNCLVAIELKVDRFEPEHLGKLNFYLEALDRDARKSHENPAIGLLLCASKDSEIVEYALSRTLSPALIAEYQTQLPDKKLLAAKLHEFYATVSLLIEALARTLGDDEPVDGFSAAKLREYYLTNRLEKGDRYFKLLLSQTDDASLKAVIKNTEQPKEPSLRVTQNFDLFSELLKDQRGDFAPVCRGLAKLVVVDIALSRDQDNPQLIFESMNSTGKELSQADLIRNFILMGLEPALQTRLYEEYWRPMEQDFGQEAYGTQFDSFMRHYLTVRTGEIPREREVYEAFKDHSRTTSVRDAGIESLVKNIRAFAGYFCAVALGREQNATLSQAFHDLRELKVDVAYPFLLELYHDYANDTLSAADFAAAVRLVESYVFRRAICAIPTNSMNKTFGTFGKALRKDRYFESIQAHFLTLPSYRRFPGDEEFRRDLQTRDLYNFRSRSYWLRRLENHDRKERVPVDEYTIEHILPQNPDLPAAWRLTLGQEWQRVQQQLLHTLGNLTLTGYNTEYSDRPFAEKRDMSGGFKQSPLKLNAGLGQLAAWNETTIQERAGRLAEQALVVWTAPTLDAETLLAYQPAKVYASSAYTIADHPNLLNPDLRVVFDAFRKEVLALDPCVSEEFMKYYVAYKAETNFVDVIPQTKRLRLSINMPFPEINDPRGLCRDITNIGRWGNGDVEVRLQSFDELPYIMGLVRQSYERQMGDGGPP